MADTVANAETVAPATGTSPATKKTKNTSAVSKKPRVKPSHPPTAEMVNNAIKSLKERGGSSLQAIKKYLTSNYKTDAEKLAPFIKKYLKSAVTSGQLIQTKGKGASGSFKLAAKETAAKKIKAATTAAGDKKPKAKKPINTATGATKQKKSPVSKKSTITDTKKNSVDKKKSIVTAKVAKKSSAIKAAKSPKQKPTKATKTSVKKPKTPKPKKATGTKKAATGGAAKKPIVQKKK